MRCWAKYNRIYSMVLNGAALSEDYCIGYALADKHVSKRCREVIEAVANQRVCFWSSPYREIDRNCGSGAASNPVVQHHVFLSETPDRDPCASRAEGCVFGRRHGHIVVHDDGTFHGPFCNLAEHTDACCLRPSAMDRVVRNHVRTDIR